jgi:uncharacterized protein YecE (DUF72 family)
MLSSISIALPPHAILSARALRPGYEPRPRQEILSTITSLIALWFQGLLIEDGGTTVADEIRMAGEIRIGTSGFSYKEWLGNFYPAKLAGPKMLGYYAERLPTVEINYTFRAMPRVEMLQRWAEQVPDRFRFALKAPQRITHFARLKGAGETLDYFVKVSAALDGKLGPALFQLPPDMKRDDALLRDFLSEMGGRMRTAFEFRNASWFDDSVLRILRESGAALCIAESEKLSTPVERTAPWVYVRLRKEGYDDAALAQWADKLRRFADSGADTYVYLKHEEAAPDLALRLRSMLKGAL